MEKKTLLAMAGWLFAAMLGSMPAGAQAKSPAFVSSSLSAVQRSSYPRERLSQRLLRIEKAYKVDIVFDYSQASKISVSASKPTSAEADIAQCVSPAGWSYTKLANNRFSITSKSKKAKSSTTASSSREEQQSTQNRHTVTGKVVDDKGEPIIGATIRQKGTQEGTVTDVDGHFSMTIDGDAPLNISYIGYLPQEVKAKNNLSIILHEDTRQLDELVVVGYGTVKRANLGGAVSTTDSRVFNSRPVQNAANALQGELAGLTVTRSGGAPGAASTLKVRDVSSINGGSPLVLIDGAEGDINTINPEDIENISVLKDGTAAIYGARASDGVILVTTKSGKRNQKMNVSFDAYYSLKHPALLKKPTNLYEQASMELEITDGTFPIEYSKDELELIKQNSDKVVTGQNWGRWDYPKFYKNQDWNKIVIGNGNMQNYNVNVQGGGQRFSYRVSLGYQHETGLPKWGTDVNKRYFVRSKTSIDLLKDLTYDLNLSYEAGNHNYSSALTEGQSVWELIFFSRSWAPLYNPAGNFYTFEGFDNPAQVLEEGGLVNINSTNFTMNNQLRWKVMDGLNIVGQAVIRKYDDDQDVTNKYIVEWNWENEENYRIARRPNNARRSYEKTLAKNFTLYADFKKSFGPHDVSLMLGASNESSNYDSFYAKRINFDQQENMSLQLGSATGQEAWSEGNAWTINSYFGRLNYGFLSRYLFEATLRADGSSRFHPDHRWGWFPGANVAWRIAEEPWLKKLNLFDELKLRASYGQMGNQSGIGLYDYIQIISLGNDYYPFGPGNKGQLATAGNIVSVNRTWETIYTTNVGLDFALLKNRLYGSVDVFWKSNRNMLIPRTYPSILGAAAPSTNSGHLSVKGWELALGWRDHAGDFDYSLRFNLSDARNRVVSRVGNNLIQLGLNATPTGYPLNSYFGYVFDGIIQNEEQLKEYKARFPKGGLPGDIAVGDAMYKDLDHDGKFSVLGDGKEGSGDVKYLGDKNPRYNFGFNFNAAYKGFDLGLFIQGTLKRTFFLENNAALPFPQPWYQSAEYWYGKTWTKDRTNAKYPAITLSEKRWYNYEKSTNTRHQLHYARLKNLQLGYTLPTTLTSRWGISKVRVYFSGEDMFEIHNTPGGWDPENLDGSYSDYPFARNYSFGINLSF